MFSSIVDLISLLPGGPLVHPRLGWSSGTRRCDVDCSLSSPGPSHVRDPVVMIINAGFWTTTCEGLLDTWLCALGIIALALHATVGDVVTFTAFNPMTTFSPASVCQQHAPWVWGHSRLSTLQSTASGLHDNCWSLSHNTLVLFSIAGWHTWCHP